MTSRTMGEINDGIGLAPLVQLASEGEPHGIGNYMSGYGYVVSGSSDRDAVSQIKLNAADQSRRLGPSPTIMVPLVTSQLAMALS